jgi:hypothetical protein
VLLCLVAVDHSLHIIISVLVLLLSTLKLWWVQCHWLCGGVSMLALLLLGFKQRVPGAANALLLFARLLYGRLAPECVLWAVHSLAMGE